MSGVWSGSLVAMLSKGVLRFLDSIYFCQEFAKGKDVLPLVQAFAQNQVGLIPWITKFRPLQLSLESIPSGFFFLKKAERSKTFSLAQVSTLLDKFEAVFLISTHLGANALIEDVVEKSMFCGLKNGFLFDSKEQILERAPAGQNSIILARISQFRGLPFYFFEMNSSFLTIKDPPLITSPLYKKDFIFNIKFLNNSIIETIGNYYLFYKKKYIEILLYNKYLDQYYMDLDSNLKVMTPLPYLLNSGKLLINTEKAPQKSFLNIEFLNNRITCEKEKYQYRFCLIKMTENFQ